MVETFTWKDAFSEGPARACCDQGGVSAVRNFATITQLKDFLDFVHIKLCLLKPYFQSYTYPLVESRELLPSFESDAFEYKNLPGFSMVALERPLNYVQEVFQFDILHNMADQHLAMEGNGCPLERNIIENCLLTLQHKLPKQIQLQFREDFAKKDVTHLENYAELMPYLLQLDRAHVLSTDKFGNFSLSGVYASFPSDLDAEIKRFGMRTGKFQISDNVTYERNRLFVYQFLMELYGFPIVSERRTSSALFARRLQRMGEKYLIRVLGQSDRTITTLYFDPKYKLYPRVEKLALVSVDEDQKDVLAKLEQGNFFVDRKHRVVILRVRYRQHKFNAANVRQDRALSVESQEVLHPLTGEILTGVNVIKDTYNMFLRLNDIVRGEYEGKIVYKRHEVVEHTSSHENRLKFLFAWLSKHQRRIIGYSDDFYAKIATVLDHYLLEPNNFDLFQDMHDLHQEVWSQYSYIQQARKVRHLEDIFQSMNSGQNTPYLATLKDASHVLHDLKFEIVNYFDELVGRAILITESLLNNKYVRHKYINKKDADLSPYGLEIKKHYGKLVSLRDEFTAIRKSRVDSSSPDRLILI